jgi:hypothetical protein
MTRRVTVMKYQNNVKYQGNFAGITITFSLQNFSQKTVERFNELLAKEALKTIENERSDRILS